MMLCTVKSYNFRRVFVHTVYSNYYMSLNNSVVVFFSGGKIVVSFSFSCLYGPGCASFNTNTT